MLRHWWIVLALVSCKARHGASDAARVKLVDRVTNSAGLTPEDLAILLPIQSWESVTALEQSFIPVSKFLSPPLYAKLMQGIVDYPGDPSSPNVFHPAQSESLSAIKTGIPLSDWYITAVRFIPCREAAWLLPATFMDQLSVAGSGLRQTFCMPMVRLSAQRFAFVGGGNGAPGQLTSDDKALHLVYAFPGASQLEWFRSYLQKLDRVATLLSAQFATSVSEDEVKLSGGTLPSGTSLATADSVLSTLESVFPPASIDELHAGVAASKSNWTALVQDIKGNAQTSELHLRPWADLEERNQRLQKILPDALNTGGLPLKIAFNFVATGVQPGFNKIWELGAFLVDSPSAGGFLQERTIFKPERLATMVDLRIEKRSTNESFQIFRKLERGERESFVDNFGAATSLDPEFAQSINKARIVGGKAIAPLVRESLRKTSNVIYAKTGAAEVGAVLVNQTDSAPLVKDEAVISYAMMHDGKLMESQTTCVSCHISSSLRFLYGLTPTTPFVADPLNMNREARGPGGIGQIEFTQQWVMRGLGYMGRIPCISDRTATEVVSDIASLRP